MTAPTPEAAAPPDEPAGRELSDETIVNPDREVRLTNGKRVVISPWGAKKGHIVLERLDALGPAMKEQVGSWDARALLSAAWDEVIELVALTLDIDRAEIDGAEPPDGWTFEDVLVTTEAVLDVCILRSDGRGALPLLVALVGKMTDVALRTAGPARARQLSHDSKPAGTSTGKSGNGTD